MIDVAFAVPGDLDAATGGYAYARKLLQELPQCGVIPHHLALPASFPDPSVEDVARTRQMLDQIHPGTPILFDGLACGAMPPGSLDGLEAPIIALVHHPLALEPGITPERQKELMESERAALAHATAVITSSHYTARTLTDRFGVATDKITIAEPGTAPAKRATGTGSPLTMLAVGSLIPRKGYGVLLDALAQIERDDWHLTIAGSPDHDPHEANRIRERILASGQRSHITLAGRVPGDKLAKLYASADLFVMPTLYEGYGMVLCEALARGLAIVSTTGGAAAETAPDAAALKVPPGDAAALATALQRALSDDALRQSLSDASWAAGQSLPRWPESAARIADLIKAVHAKPKDAAHIHRIPTT